jgi:hypothetical protein
MNGASWDAGRFGAALKLDGSDDYVAVSAPGLPAEDFTWEAWVLLERINEFQTIMEALDGAGGAELEIDVRSGGNIEIWFNNERRINTSTAIPAGAWTHVALTRSGALLQVYINGTAAFPTAMDSRPLSFGGCPLLIGVDADAGCTGALNGHLNGRIDDVRIYRRALTPSEIQADLQTPVGAR